jgi:group I intron endonuclease
MFYVYKITNLVNGKLYVGKSNFHTKISRWQKHLWLASGHAKSKGRSVIHRAISKYGKENFSFEILDTTDSEQQVFHLEKCWIGQFKDSNYELYNLTDGGEGCYGRAMSADTRKKIGLIHKGKVLTKEHRKILSLSLKGKHISEERKSNLSLFHKGRQAGTKNPNSKLNEQDVLEIKTLIAAGTKTSYIAKLFLVSRESINDIKFSRTWKHLSVNDPNTKQNDA